MNNIHVRRAGDFAVEYFQQGIGGDMVVKFAYEGNTMEKDYSREDTDHHLLHCRITGNFLVFSFIIV